MKPFFKVVQMGDGSKRFDTIEAALEEAQQIFVRRSSGQKRLVIVQAVEIVEPPPPSITLKRTPIDEYEEGAKPPRYEEDYDY